MLVLLVEEWTLDIIAFSGKEMLDIHLPYERGHQYAQQHLNQVLKGLASDEILQALTKPHALDLYAAMENLPKLQQGRDDLRQLISLLGNLIVNLEEWRLDLAAGNKKVREGNCICLVTTNNT